MKISILGAGAMGMLFGGYLSQNNEVWLVDTDRRRIDKINSDGVMVHEKEGAERKFYPHGIVESDGLPKMDLVLIFVKSMFTLAALSQNRGLIGENTYLMTLQNGAGHEVKLLRFADRAHVIIGSTQHNASVLGDGHTCHGGAGETSIGLLDGGSEALTGIAENFSSCGLQCVTSDDVKRQIWTKLFTNTSVSALTAVLQVPLGFFSEDPYAHRLMVALCKEAVTVANAEIGAQFSEEKVIADVETVCRNAKNGYTSIYADIKNGCRTEVDTISGSIVEVARRLNVSVPCHEMLVNLIHALENRPK